jgi:electron transfer flavoprotein alpha subunit
MAGQVFAYIVHKEGKADDTALELITAAGKISADAPLIAIVCGSGAHLDAVCNEMAASYQEVWKFDQEAFSYPNAEIIRKMLVKTLPPGAILLVPHDTFGMDLSPGLAIKLNTVFVSDVVGFEGLDGSSLKVIRQEFNGQVNTHVICDISAGAVINIRAGAFPADESKSAAGRVVNKSAQVGEFTVGRRFLELVQAEVGAVDITKEDILVSIGRGIEDKENIEMAEELATVIGGVVSCSRPVVDAKWLEKSRQVGTSGQTVKPKVYLALGISGSFQHLGGLKGNPFIVAVNKNPKAPIFQVADVGVVNDLLEFVPVLTEKIQAGK